MLPPVEGFLITLKARKGAGFASGHRVHQLPEGEKCLLKLSLSRESSKILHQLERVVVLNISWAIHRKITHVINISLKKKIPNNCRLLFAMWMVFTFPKMSEADGDGKDAGRFPWVLLIGNSNGQLGTSGVNVGEGSKHFFNALFIWNSITVS